MLFTLGDTLWADTGATDFLADTPGFHGMVHNSVSLLTDGTFAVIDLNLNNDWPVPHRLQFTNIIPFNPAWGETNKYCFWRVQHLLDRRCHCNRHYLLPGGATFVSQHL